MHDLTRQELFDRISAMVATLANKDINDSEVIACVNGILRLYEEQQIIKEQTSEPA